jgi:hypothetical protein
VQRDWELTRETQLSLAFTVKPDVLLRATLQYCSTVLQFWLTDCSEQIATDANKLQGGNSQKICKQNLWLDYKKEGSQSNSVSNRIGASPFLIVQSDLETLFTNLLWISTCNLFASVANCSEQSAYQNCNIVGQNCNVARKRTSGLTVTQTLNHEHAL